MAQIQHPGLLVDNQAKNSKLESVPLLPPQKRSVECHFLFSPTYIQVGSDTGLDQQLYIQHPFGYIISHPRKAMHAYTCITSTYGLQLDYGESGPNSLVFQLQLVNILIILSCKLLDCSNTVAKLHSRDSCILAANGDICCIYMESALGLIEIKGVINVRCY